MTRPEDLPRTPLRRSTCRVVKKPPQKNFLCPHCSSKESTPRQLAWHLNYECKGCVQIPNSSGTSATTKESALPVSKESS